MLIELLRGVRCAAFVVALAAFAFVSNIALAAPERPNFVIFLADDHGYYDSSVYGASDVRTPNMERLAAAGLTFTHMFVASPSCAPSRAAMLSGLMPARNGAEANHTFMRDGVKALPAYLHELGYEVAAFGKVAHGRDGQRHGFDRLDAAYDAATVAKYLDERDASKPLCLFVGTHDPHVPWTESDQYDPASVKLPPKHLDTRETRRHRAMYYTDVSTADRELGEIYDLVSERFDPANTLFIYTADHGAQWPFGKWNLYDTGIRVPMIAVWRGVLDAGAKTDALASWIDLLPTLVELAGGKPAPDIDGRSFAGLLLGQTGSHRGEIYSTQSGDGDMNIYPIRSVRTDRYKYILNLHPEFEHTTHIDKADFRPTSGLAYWRSWDEAAKSDAHAAAVVKRYHERPREELYDLERDPDEMTNLAGDAAHAELLADLRARVEAWMSQQGDQRKVFNTPRLLK